MNWSTYDIFDFVLIVVTVVVMMLVLISGVDRPNDWLVLTVLVMNLAACVIRLLKRRGGGR